MPKASTLPFHTTTNITIKYVAQPKAITSGYFVLSTHNSNPKPQQGSDESPCISSIVETQIETKQLKWATWNRVGMANLSRKVRFRSNPQRDRRGATRPITKKPSRFLLTKSIEGPGTMVPAGEDIIIIKKYLENEKQRFAPKKFRWKASRCLSRSIAVAYLPLREGVYELYPRRGKPWRILFRLVNILSFREANRRRKSPYTWIRAIMGVIKQCC